MATVLQYQDLITSEHNQKPNYMALVALYVALAVDVQNLLDSMPAAFDVDTAIGVQLDAVGLRVGVSRIITVEPSVAFPTPPDPYQVTLDDDTFRLLIKARALANKWDGTAEGIPPILEAFYGPLGEYAFVIDNEDMSITLGLAGGPVTAVQAAIFGQFYLPVRPEGVRVKNSYVPPDPYALFGLDVSNHFINGPDLGAFGDPFV